jgi:protein Mpv17
MKYCPSHIPSSSSLFLLFAILSSCHISKNGVHSFSTGMMMISNRQSLSFMGITGNVNTHHGEHYSSTHRMSPFPSSQLHLFPELSSSVMAAAASSSISASPSLMLPLTIVEEPFLTIANSYSSALQEQPFITKACTGFFLCGSGDVLAQLRANNNNNNQQFLLDMGRLLRFASKGFFGTLLWAEWYDLSDVLIQEETFVSAFQSMSMTLVPNNDNLIIILSEWSAPLARTVTLILAEQFITCPIIYGMWEIPVSTLLNGASPSKIPKEVKSKMIPMLIDNAKIWTWANLVIYNVPVSYRAICGNVMDVLWQSILSDYASDCGKDDETVATATDGLLEKVQNI